MHFTWLDLILAQFGNKSSILKAVDSRTAFRMMLCLVLVAAVGRHYDGKSLLHFPQVLIGPYFVSICLASVLYVAILIARLIGGLHPSSYRRFLLGYWLTAPLAWMYCFPIETFVDPIDSVYINLTVLSLVAIWRVVLFARIASVLTGLPFLILLGWIGPISCLAASTALDLMRIEIIGVMGGIRLTIAEQIMVQYARQATSVLGYFGYGSVAIWVLTIPWLIIRRKRPFQPSGQLATSEIGTSVWTVCGVMLAALLVGIVNFQPRLYRAAQAQQLLDRQSATAAINYMSKFERQDFPVGIFIRSRYMLGYSSDSIAERLAAIVESGSPQWISMQLLDGAAVQLLAEVDTNLEYKKQEELKEYEHSLRLAQQLHLVPDSEQSHFDATLEALKKRLTLIEE